MTAAFTIMGTTLFSMVAGQLAEAMVQVPLHWLFCTFHCLLIDLPLPFP